MPSTAIVGRDEELAVLRAFATDLAGPTALVVEGEAGIGKTTLWRAGVGYARENGCRVLACQASEPAIAFTQRLRDLADRYFADYIDGRAANHEDVANLAKQISDGLSGEYENPALLPLLVELREEVAEPSELMERASETRDYIRDTVWRMLNQRVERVDHLQAVVDGCRAIGQTDLFELNHDRVLEKALADSDIGVSDGFTRSMGDVFFWADYFERPIRHFKLHGSIIWFHRTLPEEPWRGWVVARSTTDDPYHERGAAGELLEFPADGRPVLLTGTFDKPLAYDSTIYADQHYRFHESLRKTDAVVVLGYGFRDKAINARLIGWLHGAPNRRMIVGHGDVEALVHGARFAIAGKWNRWIHDGRLRVIEKWVAETSWRDIDPGRARAARARADQDPLRPLLEELLDRQRRRVRSCIRVEAVGCPRDDRRGRRATERGTRSRRRAQRHRPRREQHRRT